MNEYERAQAHLTRAEQLRADAEAAMQQADALPNTPAFIKEKEVLISRAEALNRKALALAADASTSLLEYLVNGDTT